MIFHLPCTGGIFLLPDPFYPAKKTADFMKLQGKDCSIATAAALNFS